MAKMLRLCLIVAILCFVEAKQGSKSAIRKLNSKVDLFLGDLLEIKQSVRDLRDDVTSVHNIQNETTTCSCDPSQYTSDLESGPGYMYIAESPTDELVATIRVMQEGFNGEKAVSRSTAQQQNIAIAAIAKQVNDAKMEIEEKLEFANKATSQAKSSGYIDKDVSAIADALKAITALTYRLNGIHKHRTSIYKVHRDKQIWAKALATCQEEGFYLVEINDIEESEFVMTIVGDNYVAGNHPGAWIGGTDSDGEGTWLWATSGSVVLSSLWRNGEPNGLVGENCMQSKWEGGSNDLNCKEKLEFVCEMEDPISVLK